MLLRWLHITAGLVVIVAGAFALFAKKGSRLHRSAGTVFFVAMVTLTATGAIAATFVHPNRGNVVAAFSTFYLVTTAWLTVKRDVVAARGWYVALMALGFATGLRALSLGVLAVRHGPVDQFPPAPFFLFALVVLSAAALDARLLVAGHIAGAQRLVRHLWRMGMAYWIATASLFLGQAKFFPAPIRASGLLVVPVLLVAGTTLYWLVRTLRGRKAMRSVAKATQGT
ncbi:hypothetical protein LYSHEL_19490 [Lysobacter helvus]|uniref:DUF2306 domain-containing protein n=2 Tax=Lysobacteraceae TaxID=32033 RepID=A0ABM7Q6F6_9GAMM|nr:MULTISPECIES: hypothetical protein [Lysobacter]BCT92926.1 hypothetical protein LYSCAS_19500 [Lysobacter caseinilyticus]BCT96078.1 hypothetical protein LYSHEL_19490 [Lysobacter helvus]